MALADRKQLAVKQTAFERWIDTLTEKNRGYVLGWLEDGSLSHQTVADWIREDDADDDYRGYPAGKDTVSVWRRDHGVVRS